MSWEKLPYDVRSHIFLKAREIFQEKSKIIQHAWRAYSNPQIVAKQLWIEHYEYAREMGGGIEPHFILPETLKLIKFTSRVLSGNGSQDKINFWHNIIYSLHRCLWLEEFTGGPYAHIYNNIQEHFYMLANTFKLPLVPEEYFDYLDNH